MLTHNPSEVADRGGREVEERKNVFSNVFICFFVTFPFTNHDHDPLSLQVSKACLIVTSSGKLIQSARSYVITMSYPEILFPLSRYIAFLQMDHQTSLSLSLCSFLICLSVFLSHFLPASHFPFLFITFSGQVAWKLSFVRERECKENKRGQTKQKKVAELIMCER